VYWGCPTMTEREWDLAHRPKGHNLILGFFKRMLRSEGGTMESSGRNKAGVFAVKLTYRSNSESAGRRETW
jgi:hypothetical protein